VSALDIIKKFEGCRLEAYQDVGGVWTIGYGFTKDVSEGDTITQEQADLRLVDEVESFASIVDHQVQVPLNPNQRDALTSFVYNIGSNAFQRSTLLDLLNQGDYAGASNEIPRWDRIHNVENQGLANRRHAEQELFDTYAAPIPEPEPVVVTKAKPEPVVETDVGSPESA